MIGLCLLKNWPYFERVSTREARLRLKAVQDNRSRVEQITEELRNHGERVCSEIAALRERET